MPDWLSKPFAVLLIDLVLAGDNALVIAMVCRTLPPRHRRLALLLGASGAVVMRVLLTGLAASVLAVPGLKFVGGLLLSMLALNLALPVEKQAPVAASLDQRSEVVAAAVLVILFDLLMSLDNVLALAAVAGDSLLYLGLGLLLSISIVMFASAVVARLLDRFPNLELLGAALLGFVAGQMVVSDPLIQRWIATQAPALAALVPMLAAAYVYLLGRAAPVIPRTKRIAPYRPAARPKPARAPTAPPSTDTSSANVKQSERLTIIALMALFTFAGLMLGFVAYIGGGFR